MMFWKIVLVIFIFYHCGESIETGSNSMRMKLRKIAPQKSIQLIDMESTSDLKGGVDDLPRSELQDSITQCGKFMSCSDCLAAPGCTFCNSRNKCMNEMSLEKCIDPVPYLEACTDSQLLSCIQKDSCKACTKDFHCAWINDGQKSVHQGENVNVSRITGECWKNGILFVPVVGDLIVHRGLETIERTVSHVSYLQCGLKDWYFQLVVGLSIVASCCLATVACIFFICICCYCFIARKKRKPKGEDDEIIVHAGRYRRRQNYSEYSQIQ